MRVVCISDTHGLHAALHLASPIPPGDVLVHAGDFTDTGARDEVVAFNAWLATLPHKYKIVIAGNHESTFDRAFYPRHWHQYGHEQEFDPTEVRALLTNALYLEDAAVLIDGFLFYGSPWQPEFCNWAFNLPRGDKLVAKWKQIPNDVDVLVTHTPPLGRGDQVGHLRVGCSDLLHEVLTRIKPPFHVFGHVHEGYGRSSDGVTTYLNASCCTHEYEAVNPPMVIDLKKPRAVHDAEANHAMRYDVMLHEQLRVCSQKPAFVPRTRSSSRKEGAADGETNGRKASLKEFGVDGTTAALLFESTLKLRPVKTKQTRALRYLFHHGFTGGEGEASAVGGGQLDEAGSSLDAERQGETPDEGRTSTSAAEERIRERRRVSLSRRVTMAVLEELPDATRDAIAPTPAALLTISTAESSSATATTESPPAASEPSPTKQRARRDKTLHRRDAVAKLATMVEEPDKETAAAAEAQASATSETASVPNEKDASATATTDPEPKQPDEPPQDPPAPATEPPLPPTPAKECIMCKYKVSGHVHPGSDSPAQAGAAPTPTPTASPSVAPPAAVAPPPVPATATATATASADAAAAPPPAPATECILCKYKVAGHVHPGAEPPVEETREDVQDRRDDEDEEDDEATATTAAGRNRAVGPKRLSSWF